jgi:membrane-bound serine protease (ClpP class)
MNKMFGNDLWLMVVLFIFGGILMVLELIIPGISIPGIAGLLSLIGGIIVGSSILTPGQMAVVIFLVFVLTVIMVVLIYRAATKNGKMSKLLFLKSRAIKEEGYSSSSNFADMVGKVGITTTVLRPSGSAEFDGVKLDVIADGQFIAKGVKVEVVKVEGFRILVEEVSKDSADII